LEDAELGLAILANRSVAIEVIGGKVEPNRDLGMEFADGLELERTDFDRKHSEVVAFARGFDERFADVTAGHGGLPAGVQHLRNQLGCRGLAVCPSDADHGHGAKLITKLELADDRN